MRRRPVVALIAVLVVVAGGLAFAREASAASIIQIQSMDSGGVRGHMGWDNINDNTSEYVNWTNWQTNGAVDGGGVATAGVSNGHLEIYPDSNPGAVDTYDAWTQTVGGAHLWFRPVPAAVNLGVVPLPRVGDGKGAFRLTGSLQSSGSLPDDRFKILWFQLTNWQQTSGGREVGAFGLSRSHGNQWTAGIVWPGQYVMVVTDNSNGSQVSGLLDLAAGTTPVLDADAFCYGMAQCQYDAGSPPANAGGGFHPMSPVRVVDTRNGTGIANGPVRPGDGRVNDIDPTYRKDFLDNHELKVTGANDVPEHGVSAVLLNVTVTEPTKEGWLGIYPRLARTDVFDDQSWFRRGAPTSNLNFVTGDTLPNLVLARVGAGGYIRFENSQGDTHVVADIVGWYDSSSPADGDGFVGVVPARLLDTRDGTGGIGGRINADETRDLSVVGKFDVPTDASAVVLNVTMVGAAGNGFITAWPTGTPKPVASSLNQAPGRTRPNLVVSKVGKGGKVSFFFSGSAADLVVDVVGYYGRGGGKTYSVTPERILDSRSGIGTKKGAFGIGETRQLQVAGLPPVPADATAVIMNVTGTGSPLGTYITAWPYGVDLPTASNVNLSPGDTAPNLVMVKIGVGGKVSLYAHTGADIIADVVGYVR